MSPNHDRVTLYPWDGRPETLKTLRPALGRLVAAAVRAAPDGPVVIKPNFRFGCDMGRGPNTDPQLVRLVAACVLEAGAGDVWILDSTPHVQRFTCPFPGVTVADTDHLEPEMLPLPDCGLLDIAVPGVVRRAALIISLPVLKTHALTLISGAVKGVLGLVRGDSERRRVHLGGLEPGLAALHRALPDGLTIMDASVALEGLGPGPAGRDRRLGFILCAPGRAAVDVAVCRVAALDPAAVAHVALAAPGLVARGVEVAVAAAAGHTVTFPPDPFLDLPPSTPPAGLPLEVRPGDGGCLLCDRALFAALHLERREGLPPSAAAPRGPRLTAVSGPGGRDRVQDPCLLVGNCLAHAWAGRPYVPGCPPPVRHIRPLLRRLLGRGG